MTIFTATKVESTTLTTTPTRVWSVNATRIGIMVHAASTNSGNLLIMAVEAGTVPSTLTTANAHIELSPGQSFEGDLRYNSTKDIYVAMTSGTGSFNAYEVVNP